MRYIVSSEVQTVRLNVAFITAWRNPSTWDQYTSPCSIASCHRALLSWDNLLLNSLDNLRSLAGVHSTASRARTSFSLMLPLSNPHLLL